MSISAMTPEERKKYQEKRKENTEKLKQDALASGMKIEYADMNHWEALARKYKFRLPSPYYPSSTLKYPRKLMRHLGVDTAWLSERCACKNIAEWCMMNHTWSSRAICGIILEDFDSEEKENR
jgi:hypothetical protein